MFIYPYINPVALSIGPLAIHWYGIMYIVGFTIARTLGRLRARELFRGWEVDHIDDLIFYAALGVLLGGRIGYIIFYDFFAFIHDPLLLFRLWQGGMSFHGGVIGVILALFFYARKHHKNFFDVTDFVVPLIPLGIAFGRIGNFINGELWGRPTDVPWGMIFPFVDKLPRHPSQLYEAFGEGLLLFFIVWFFSQKQKPRMATSGCFCLGYGCIRFVLEFFRTPDIQLGFIVGNWLTMGQLLSLPLIILGTVLLYKSQAFSFTEKLTCKSTKIC